MKREMILLMAAVAVSTVFGAVGGGSRTDVAGNVLFGETGEWQVVQTSPGVWQACPDGVVAQAAAARHVVASALATSSVPRLAAATQYLITFSFNGVEDFSVPVEAGQTISVKVSLPNLNRLESCWIDGEISAYPDNGCFVFADVSANHSVNFELIKCLYVDASRGDDGNSGYAEDVPKRTLQAAVNAAAGLPVMVSPGVYGPVSAVSGGMVLSAVSKNVAETVIDGGGSARAVTFPAGTTGSVSGFTIRNGWTSGSGAGIWAEKGTSVVVRRCVVTGCSAGDVGGAVCGAQSGSAYSLTLRDSLIVRNNSSSTSAAARSVKMVGCTVADNTGGGNAVTSSEAVLCAIRGGFEGADVSSALSPTFLAKGTEPYRLLRESPQSAPVSYEPYLEADELDLSGELRPTEGCCGCYVRSHEKILGVSVNGTDCLRMSGPGWRYDGGDRVSLFGPNQLVVSGESTEIGFCVVSNSMVVVSNLTVRREGELRTALQVNEDVTVDLSVAGINEFQSGSQAAGIFIKRGSTVRIRAAAGCSHESATLKASGGDGSSGIGNPRWYSDCGRVEIYSGNIVARGLAGIGGVGVTAPIWIYGGTVQARAANVNCDIGSTLPIQQLIIKGGNVVADRASKGVHGARRGGENGDEPISCVTVKCASGRATVTGLPSWYGVNDLVAVDGKLCFYLPNGTYNFSVNGTKYVAVVSGNDIEATVDGNTRQSAADDICAVPVDWTEEYGYSEADLEQLYAFLTNFSLNPVAPGSSARLENWQSYVAGLDPTRADDMFYAVISNAADGSIVVGPNALREGRAYAVEVSHALPFEAWTNIAVGADGCVALPRNGSNEFYRVTVDVKGEE